MVELYVVLPRAMHVSLHDTELLMYQDYRPRLVILRTYARHPAKKD